METIGLEISDAGILAAGGKPVHVLEVDQQSIESPGYALQAKKQIVVGQEALAQSRLHPRQVNSRFWLQLSTHPLTEKSTSARNYAEIAFKQLEQVRDRLSSRAASWVVAVPGFLDESKLGILLGIARELSVPVQGLVSAPVAASRHTNSSGPLVYVDVHLHRVELSRLSHGNRVAVEKTHVIPEDGWDNLYEQLAKGLADEFVRATRFDPLHDASTEQQLHNQLISLLGSGLPDDGMPVELTIGRTTHTLLVLPQMMRESSTTLRDKVTIGLKRLLEEQNQDTTPMTVQLSHRAAQVPGLLRDLAQLPNITLEELPPGAAAMGALELVSEFAEQPAAEGIPFLTSRRGQPDETAAAQTVAPSPTPDTTGQELPTHVLHGDHAYLIDKAGLVVGLEPNPDETGIRLPDETQDTAARHCLIRLHQGQPVLELLGPHRTLLDGEPTAPLTPLRTGHRIQVGGPPQELRLIVVSPLHGA